MTPTSTTSPPDPESLLTAMFTHWPGYPLRKIQDRLREMFARSLNCGFLDMRHNLLSSPWKDVAPITWEKHCHTHAHPAGLARLTGVWYRARIIVTVPPAYSLPPHTQQDLRRLAHRAEGSRIEVDEQRITFTVADTTALEALASQVTDLTAEQMVWDAAKAARLEAEAKREEAGYVFDLCN